MLACRDRNFRKLAADECARSVPELKGLRTLTLTRAAQGTRCWLTVEVSLPIRSLAGVAGYSMHALPGEAV